MSENQNPADIAGNATKALAAAEAAETTQTQEPAPQTSPSTPPEPTGIGQAAAPIQEQVQYTGIRDYAKSELGVDLGFQDDRQAFQALLQAYQQQKNFEPYQPYVQEYLQHAPQFREWRQQQERARQAPAPSPWSPPASREEVSNLMSRYYERGENGEIKAKSDAPLEVRQKVEAYSQYVQDFREKLQHDPMNALKPLVEQMLAPHLQAQHEQIREDYAAKQALQTHASWFYASDAQGQRAYDQNGNPALSPAGNIYKHFVQDAEAKGIRGVTRIDDYALKMTHAHLLMNQQPAVQQKPQTPRDDRNGRFLAQNNRRPNSGAAAGTMPVSQKGMSLAESMRAVLEAAGSDPAAEEAAELGLARSR